MQLTMNNEDFDALKTLMEEEFGLSLKAHTRESFTKKIWKNMTSQALNPFPLAPRQEYSSCLLLSCP